MHLTRGAAEMRIGILTGGGDCPGLNPVIRAVVRRALLAGYEIVGIKNGWKGLVENDTMPLNINAISGILPKGGTILGTSRTNPYKKEGDLKKVQDNFKKMGLDALVAVGGEDTLGVASKLVKDGLPNIVGVPKTIDNDLSATDYTFGFDTALNVAMECIDRLHTTAESHHRIIIAEVMGRHAGWIAIEAGIAGGADVILIPEKPIDLEEVCKIIKQRHERGKTFSIVVVAEGAQFKGWFYGDPGAEAGRVWPCKVRRYRGNPGGIDRGEDRFRNPGQRFRPYPKRRFTYRF